VKQSVYAEQVTKNHSLSILGGPRQQTHPHQSPHHPFNLQVYKIMRAQHGKSNGSNSKHFGGAEDCKGQVLHCNFVAVKTSYCRENLYKARGMKTGEARKLGRNNRGQPGQGQSSCKTCNRIAGAWA
jgi:hypothetical protein